MPDIVANTYARDCNMKKLQHQLLMLPDLVSAYKSLQSLTVFTVTSVRTVGEMLICFHGANNVF